MKTGDEPRIERYTHWPEGLTKREYFAAMAMQAILTETRYALKEGAPARSVANGCVFWADKLIEALSKENIK